MFDASKTLFLFGLLTLAFVVFWGGKLLRQRSSVDELSSFYDAKQKWVLFALSLLLLSLLTASSVAIYALLFAD